MVPKLLVKLLSGLNVFIYVLSRGQFGALAVSLPVFLLTTTGRRSSKPRTTPLGYLVDGRCHVIIGSYAGHAVHPAWFHNLRANPRASDRLKGRRMSATTHVAEWEERERLWSRLMEAAPSYGRYQARTTRRIPLVILEPASSE